MIDDERIDWFELIVLIFTVYILVSLSLQFFITLDTEIVKILSFFDMVSSVIFLIDWFGRFIQSTKKMKFFFYNFLDLIASLPLIFLSQYLGFLKILRFIQLFRIIKIIGGINRLNYYRKRNKFELIKLIFPFIFFTILVFGPVLILIVEKDVGNIKTAEQALWWTYCTFTTIGYGDFYPSSSLGRIIAVIVSLGGISMFGFIASLIANFFVNATKTDNTSNGL